MRRLLISTLFIPFTLAARSGQSVERETSIVSSSVMKTDQLYYNSIDKDRQDALEQADQLYRELHLSKKGNSTPTGGGVPPRNSTMGG